LHDPKEAADFLPDGGGDVATILVADDEEPILDLLADVLTSEGYIVIIAHDGREALALARTRRPDLVLSDVMMPYMDGPELARRLHMDTETHDMPVVLMSAARLPDRAAVGIAGFLAKPFDIWHIAAIVQMALEGEPKRDPLRR
jgi:two-component system sensor histidine kinase/response regulator